MRKYTDTDREILCECSCEICGSWHWRPQAGLFICDDCKQERKQNRENYRNRNLTKKPTQSAIHKAGVIFQVVVDNPGISQRDIMREMTRRGWKQTSNSPDYLGLLDYTGHLIWLDDDGLLHPYKNTNTGEYYD
jgi:hypothetical protein